MQCSECGGLVIWKGPLSALTHTECQNCGAENAQLPEGEEFIDEDPAVSHSVEMAERSSRLA